ncbi:3-isopropylmalate/(R)-2-methylmalate dehydratase small subunit [Albimonas donghaensis]|uniref:3-isopropylmalate dehydratase n=1 Tax=Albimonas donghaensis TaxID=356660 RepID=A0A1H2X6S8_9RHOB|nr:3-isopropylmalate dehydratase small subunit [Albimonas donghaensis]SDW88466.1 3-isopropylmalate/(R)-2-methylmalate dehydratase small subunit [Albimonas donghaensis]
MDPFRKLDAVACPLPLSGVDTDQLIPARFMSRPRSEGYGPVLLHDLRHDADGAPVPGFPLDAPERAGARILVARRNFGGGSSREAAVYALVDHGIRAVIAPSFGDIFSGNAVNNGLLPARVTEAEAETLLDALAGGLTRLEVDLEAQEIRGAGAPVAFEIAPVWRTKLLNGWDDLDLTRARADDIAAFAARDAVLRPWAIPAPEPEG